MKNIRFEKIKKAYGKNVIIPHMDLCIRPGERMILLGPSGCGKSTILRIIAGLEEITGGSLYMGEKKMNDIPCGDRNVAMVFQNYALFPHMTVEQNISYGMKVHHVPKEELQERTKTAVSMMHLNGLEKRLPKNLSGGQRQRVALARAVVKQSDYFLLDEPLSNLDMQLRGYARKELVHLHEKYHSTMVYVTHDQIEAMTVGQRIAVLSQGMLQMVGTPDEVYNHPANVFTARFIGAPPMNVTEAKVESGKLVIGNQAVYLPEPWRCAAEKYSPGNIYFGIRPEDIRLTDHTEENQWKGTVKYQENYGNKMGVYFEIEGVEFIALCSTWDGGQGDTVYVSPDFNKIHLFDFRTEQSIRRHTSETSSGNL